MDKYTATEQAYKHGYEKGYAAGKRDAVEVVHGRWIKVFDDSAGWVDMCGKCKEFGDGTPYCPNCGAKMDGRA